ncbi:MAG TPA: aminotransferase class I/II-fold pyridoxal phosphate-dependent enzyme, partial [Anaerolineales bacterium]|nr:aminotransferase class I/II-fold pyridoxal phosphate-dependent enzyme [Anaerolineales bacterium]
MAGKVPMHFFAEQAETIRQMQAEGQDVIALDIGSPDLPPHPEVVAELHRAAQRPNTHGYQPHSGTAKLRRAWAELYRREFGVGLDPDGEVLPLLGSKEGIFHLMQAIVSPGDIVLVPDPGYVTYQRGTEFAGGQVHFLPLRPENG